MSITFIPVHAMVNMDVLPEKGAEALASEFESRDEAVISNSPLKHLFDYQIESTTVEDADNRITLFGVHTHTEFDTLFGLVRSSDRIPVLMGGDQDVVVFVRQDTLNKLTLADVADLLDYYDVEFSPEYYSCLNPLTGTDLTFRLVRRDTYASVED